MHLIKRTFLYIFLLLSFVSCEGKNNFTRAPSPLIHPDKWLLTGRIANQGFTNGEVLALALDGMRYSAPIKSDDSFGIALAGNASYAIHFLTESQSREESAAKKTAGREQPPLLQFEESPDIGIRDTLRLPKVLFNRQLNFGEIDIKEQAAFPTINPATKLDFDHDGINDLSDSDDNNDRLSDHEQKQALERVQVCHTSEDARTTSQKVPLASLYHHTSHGDPIGPCQASVAPNPNVGVNNSAQGKSASYGQSAGNTSKKVANDWRPSDYKPSESTAAADKKKEEDKKSETKAEDKKGDSDKDKTSDDKKSGKQSDSEESEGEEEEEEEDSSDLIYDDEEEEEEEDDDEPKRRDRGDEDDEGDDGDKAENGDNNKNKKKPRKQTSTRGPKKKTEKDKRGAKEIFNYFFE